GNTGAPVATYVAPSAASLGVGPVILTNGIFQLGGNFAIPNPVTLNGGLVVLSGANPFVFNGAVNVAATTTLQAATAATVNRALSGAGGLTLLSGNVTLTAANTYTGATTVSGGTLTVSGAGTLASTTNLTLNQGGTLTLDNTGTSLNRV